MRNRIILTAVATVVLAGSLTAAGPLDSLTKGTPDIKHAGALAFGPEGILFIGDALNATIFAVDTGDRPSSAGEGALKVDGINEKIASRLGVEAKQLRVNDLAVNPLSGNAYLSVARGQGTDSQPVILTVNRSGEIKDLPLKDVKFAKVAIPNAPDPSKKDRRGTPQRVLSITSMAYVDGRLIIAGLSNEEFASTLRAVKFPFAEADKGSAVEIYHGAHGAVETHSPVRTFAAYKINDKQHLLAAYTCTPLVKFPVNDLEPGKKVRGTTVAELGNMNQPLDMIVYTKAGKDYVLIANTRLKTIKVSTENIDKIEGINSRISGGGKAGLTYDTIKELEGIEQMSQLDKGHAVVLVRGKEGSLNMQTIALP